MKPTNEDITQLAADTDETMARVRAAWDAYLQGCYERHESFSWEDFVRRFKRECDPAGKALLP